MPLDVLIVEPDPSYRDYLVSLFDTSVDIATDFMAARRRLEQMRPELLITNLKLGAYNGINLVHVVDPRYTTSIVYTVAHDAGSARDVKEAGAFYELLSVLPMVLPSYMLQIATARARRLSEDSPMPEKHNG